MLIKINFKKALLISLSWHLFCFFAFTIVIVPIGIGPKRLSDIYFLGSILDKNSSDSSSTELASRSYIKHNRDNSIFSAGNGSSLKRIRVEKDKSYHLNQKDKSKLIGTIIDTDKKVINLDSKETKFQLKKEIPEISGQAKNRSVLFKPPLPDYESLMSNSNVDISDLSLKVKLKVVISKDGSVKSAESIETSGYPEIDLIAIRYLKKWQFSLLSPDSVGADEEGAVTIEFNKQR